MSLLFETTEKPAAQVAHETGLGVVTGIDPGASGGIAHLVAGVLEVIPMPWITNEGIDGPVLKQFLAYSKHVFIEQVQVRPGQSVVALKTSLTQWGRCCGIVEGMGIPLTLVHPQTWRKEMECQIPKGGTPEARRRALKARSIVRARQIWPRERFLPTERCKVANDGMCEAALIAEYGRRKLTGQTWNFTGGGE